MSQYKTDIMVGTITHQAIKITELEKIVQELTTENVRLNQANEHHKTMRTQQEGIIRTLQGGKE